MKNLTTLLLLLVLTGPVFAQVTGFFDDFEDGSVDTTINGSTYTLWKADHPGTFGITESDGLLHFAYTRTSDSDMWDNFNFTPPEVINVSGNPVISLKIKSDVTTTFRVKPIYSNDVDNTIIKDVPGDEQWHTYNYELVEANYSGTTLKKIYLYFDGGSTDIISGNIQFDDFQIAGFAIKISDLNATLVDSASVDLSWTADNPDERDYFSIYRSTEAGFAPDQANRIAQTTEPLYQDTGLENFTTYHYLVSATDNEGREHSPAGVSIRTTTPGAVPHPEVLAENANPVGKYEKYELLIGITNATFDNPYNPEEIDLRAWFWSPDGDSLLINGFYDNYKGADAWKIRFSANMPGTWEYQVYATDIDGTGSSERGSFVVEDSEHKGWIRISPDNPNYLMHDDGSSFYGLSVYYPWAVTEAGLDDLRDFKLNLFGYWDCTFDWNTGNGGGRYLLEGIESGLGKYNQDMAARIDELLEWSEERDLKLMLAIWAHPYLRVEGKPWSGGHWYEQNPYSEIVEVEEFYTDSLAFAYQEKHYRYMIARFGYSRAMGIWELINEMHGTSGWVDSQENAKLWVEKVHTYFKENDPFQRATTASFGSGDGDTHYSVGDKLGDMPNIHFYEQHGFPNMYPDNVLRSGLNNVVTMNRKLKSKGDRPAFFGEAGYDHMFADVNSDEYTWEMHNSFWASLTTGMASTPVWWDFDSRTEVLTDERMDNYTRMHAFVSGIDFAHLDLSEAGLHAGGVDGYFMGSDTCGFGWMYSYEANSGSGLPFHIYNSEVQNGNYLLQWYNTWTGEFVDNDKVYSVQGYSWGEGSDKVDKADAAFRISRSEDGGTAENVNLHLMERDSLMPDPAKPWLMIEAPIYMVACYMTDANNFMDVSYNGPAQLTIEYGGGEDPLQTTVDLSDGGVVFPYNPSGSSGAVITVTVDGVGSATLSIEGIVGIDEKKIQGATTGFILEDIYPNPSDRETTFTYILTESSHVSLILSDARGSLVETLVNEDRAPGSHKVQWDAHEQPAGVYFCTLRTGKAILTKRFVIL